MQNLKQARVIDEILTSVVRGVKQNKFIGSSLFPDVTVYSAGGKIINFNDRAAFKQYDTLRAPGADSKRMEIGFGADSYSLQGHSLEAKLPREVAREASVVPKVDLAARYVKTVWDTLLLQREREQAALATNAANYATSNKAALTGAQKWSDPSSDPKADYLDAVSAIRAKTGQRPNYMAMGPIVEEALLKHPKVADHFKYTSSQSLTREMLRQYFGVETLEVGDALTAGDNGVFADVWGNDVVLAYTKRDAETNEEQNFGYNYVMDGEPSVEVPYYDNKAKSWIYGVNDERQAVIAWSDAGFVFKGAA